MISYSKYKLLREAESPTPASPPATGPIASAPAPPTSPDTSLGAPPPGFGGPPMGGLGGGGPSFDMGGLGGGAPTGSASDLKPSGLKSSNVWDVLEKLVSNSSKKDKNAGV